MTRREIEWKGMLITEIGGNLFFSTLDEAKEYAEAHGYSNGSWVSFTPAGYCLFDLCEGCSEDNQHLIHKGVRVSQFDFDRWQDDDLKRLIEQYDDLPEWFVEEMRTKEIQERENHPKGRWGRKEW